MSASALFRPQVPSEKTHSPDDSSPEESSTSDVKKHAMDPMIFDQYAHTVSKGSDEDAIQQWGTLAYHRSSSGHDEYSLTSPQDTLANESGESSVYSTTISPREAQFGTGGAEAESGHYTSPSSRRSRVVAKGVSSWNAHPNTIPPADAAASASDRSERARNAANHRHSRVKERTLDEDPDSRQTIEREKNRLAAAKCRRKKRARNDELDTEYRAAASANTRMKREQRELRDQLTYWRMLALQHVNGRNGCRCDAIQRYNLDQAFKAVYDMDGSMHESLSSRLDAGRGKQDRVLAPAG